MLSELNKVRTGLLLWELRPRNVIEESHISCEMSYLIKMDEDQRDELIMFDIDYCLFCY